MTWLPQAELYITSLLSPPPTARFVPQRLFRKLTKSSSLRPSLYCSNKCGKDAFKKKTILPKNKGGGTLWRLLVSEGRQRGKNLNTSSSEPLLCIITTLRKQASQMRERERERERDRERERERQREPMPQNVHLHPPSCPSGRTSRLGIQKLQT